MKAVLTLMAAALLAPGLSAQEAEDSTPAPDALDLRVPFAGPAAGPFGQPGPDEPVAFWIHLDDGKTPSMAVTEKEWDSYVNYIRTIYPVADEVRFNYAVLNQILDRNLMLMRYHRNAETVFRRAANVVEKLKEGADWNRMVRLHTEDEDTPSDGLYGGLQRRLSRYPLEATVFEGEVGDVVGPVYTYWGAEIFLIQSRRGERKTKDEQVIVKYILLKWGMPLSKKEWPELRRQARISSDNPRFIRILPPGMLGTSPESFGPTDIAPIGDPEKMLVQHSCDDRFHNKTPSFSRPGDPGYEADPEKGPDDGSKKGPQAGTRKEGDGKDG